jgi:glucosyl-3-phosphoglycerate phosphatase
VLLWRHGRTASNATGRFQGQEDIPLDDVGALQVKRAAEVLASSLAGSPVRIVSSDLSRAMSTAAALGDLLSVPVEPDPRLREVHAGAWQGLLKDEILAGWPAEYAAWRRGDPDVRLGGTGETRREAARRAAAAIETHTARTEGVLVCAGHGGTLRGAVFDLIGLPDMPWGAVEGLRNAHWAELTPGWRLARYNVSA